MNQIDPKSCSVCGKGNTVGNNVPHSQHKTKRVIKPNIQKQNGKMICTRCMRTKTKNNS